ncbi:hypothetical protein ACQJBY_011148 [Aegilops geniculata]
MEHQQKAGVQSAGSNKSSQSGSFDFEHDQSRDTDRREVVVKIDADPPTSHAAGGTGGSGSGSTSPSARGRTGEMFSFQNPQQQSAASPALGVRAECSQDPADRLIGNFLRKQAAAGGELLLDPDLEIEENQENHETWRPPRPPTSVTNSRELRVSFQDPHKRLGQSSSSASSSDATADNNRNQDANARVDTAEVVRCTSTSAGNDLLSRSRTRSRLMDPPPPSNVLPGADGERNDRKSFVMKGRPKSGHYRSGLIGMSGLIGKSGGALDDEDDDPFIDEGVTAADFKRERTDCLIILEWTGLVIIVATLVCSFKIRSLQGKEFSGLPLWKWEVLVFVLICGRLVSGWVLRITVFFVERNFMLRKKVLYFVYGVRRAVRTVLWLGAALISWHLLFDNGDRLETQTLVLHYVTKVLLCLLVATVIRLVKTLLVKVLASSFHVSTYFDRIQDALFNQYVIETLSGPPLVDDVQRLQSAGATTPRESAAAVPKSGRLSKQLQKQKSDDGISIDQLQKMNQKNVSAWSMKRLMRIIRYGALTTMDDQIKHASDLGDEMATQIHSEHEAKVAAKKIFHNVAKPGSKHIYLSDLMRFMRQEEAVKAMDLFEGAKENNRVSKRALKNWVVNAFRERKALALTLNDTKTAVNKLHQMANVLVALIVLALWLLILGIATTRLFVLLSSQLVLAVFMFGNTLKTVFEAIVFLFIVHPFDVGDRCEVDGMQVVVEEMNILTTIFLRHDNLKIYYPNSQLAILPIMNYYRSPDMGDAVDFSVNVATPAEKLALMKERLMHYLDNKKEHWYPGSMIVLRDIDDTNRLKLTIWCRHTINFQDIGMRYERRELILQEMMKILRDLDIEYRMLQLDINVRNAPPIHSNRMPTTWNTNF